jgi:hypothetical protein
MSPAVRWLLLEGSLPLLGAGLIYLVLGACKYIVNSGSKFEYDWMGALDPLGWLYGTVVLAIQSALVNAAKERLVVAMVAVALVSFLLLLVAMTERSANQTWKSSKKLQGTALALVVATLWTGYTIRSVPAAPEVSHGNGVPTAASASAGK